MKVKSILSALLFVFSSYFAIAQNNDAVTALENSFKKAVRKEFKATEIHIKEDTLVIVSLSEFLYYPFGKYPVIENFVKRSNLEWYRSVDKFVYNDTAQMTVYKFWRLDDSYISFFISLNTELMELISANITDSEIVLKNRCRTGISKQDFFNLFFNSATKNMFNEIKYVKFVSGLYEIEHVYIFDNDTLKRILFLTEYHYRYYR